MAVLTPKKLLRLLMSSDDQQAGKPLYEAIVDHCRESGIEGASVFAGLEGFGESGEVVRPHGFSRIKPITISVIDDAEKITALLDRLRPLMQQCLVAVSDVATLRIQRTGQVH